MRGGRGSPVRRCGCCCEMVTGEPCNLAVVALVVVGGSVEVVPTVVVEIVVVVVVVNAVIVKIVVVVVVMVVAVAMVA